MRILTLAVLTVLYSIIYTTTTYAFVAKSQSYEIAGFGVEQESVVNIAPPSVVVPPVIQPKKVTAPVTRRSPVVEPVLHSAASIIEPVGADPVDKVVLPSITIQIHPLFMFSFGSSCGCGVEKTTTKLLPLLGPWELFMIWITRSI